MFNTLSTSGTPGLEIGFMVIGSHAFLWLKTLLSHQSLLFQALHTKKSCTTKNKRVAYLPHLIDATNSSKALVKSMIYVFNPLCKRTPREKYLKIKPT
jgi:hypothetical protein